MGRTRRQRLLKKKQAVIDNLGTDATIIDLNKWLKNNLWFNETKLKITSFPCTGRGVMTMKNIDPGDIIIEIPYKLMITYTVLENCENFKSFVSSSEDKFLILELLSLYLLLEKHLGEQSFWSSYIKSLPSTNELRVIWLCSEQELGYINEELSIGVKEERNKFEESWLRVGTLLQSSYTCGHCGARADQILTRDLYTWAYVLVYTRSVYLDAMKVNSVSNFTLEDILLDDPSMGLCPFLDMFNHNYNTYTHAYLSDANDILNYFLVTSSKFKKYAQVFIAYGAHDNKRLITQYGFTLPKNEYDTIEFELKDILVILKLSANNRQYKFIRDRKLDESIFMNYTGCSFNMEAVLYVLTNQNEFKWASNIFSADFSKKEYNLMYNLAKQLLQYKLELYDNELEQIRIHRLGTSCHFELYINYLQARIDLVKDVLNNVIVKYVL